MAQWADLKFDEPLYRNIDESAITNAQAALENCYINPAGGYSRFPGLRHFVSIPGSRTYLTRYRNDLYAVSNEGRIYRIDKNGTAQDITGVALSGGRRPTFTATDESLLMAAGGPIISVANNTSKILSVNAPDTTHVVYLQGYVIALEPYSGRFYISQAGVYSQWDPLDVFTAEQYPDDATALAVTPFNELLVCGEDSIEQYEPFASGTQPFVRRWSTGEGLLAPYTVLPLKEGTFGINPEREFIRFELQSSTAESDDITLALQNVEDWTDAWSAQVLTKGQKFILLQIPNAENVYGTMGQTWIYDYRSRRWSELYGWSDELGVPDVWPGQSVVYHWGQNFVGVPGGVAVLDPAVFSNLSTQQRLLFRTGHVDRFGESRVDKLRIRMKRGVVDYNESDAYIRVRVNKDNRGFGRWLLKPLGKSGHSEMVVDWQSLGIARTWQFEFECAAPHEIEIVKGEIFVEQMPGR